MLSELTEQEKIRQHLLGQIWTNSPDNMFVIRPGEDDFYMVNANLAERNTFELISALPQNTPLRSIVPDDIYQRVSANYRRCLALKAPVSYEEEENITRHDGKTTWWSTILSPIFDNQGEVEYLFGISRNITALKEAQKAAEEANEVKTAFLANMSHEMRTPLNAIIGAAELLKHGKAEDSEQLHALILNAADTLARQTADIIDYARIDAGQLRLTTAPFAVRQICQNVADLLQAEAQRKGIRFVQQIDDAVPPLLLGDGGRLKQILLNLLSNAIKFTHDGEVALQVSLENRLGQDYQLRFEIRDTGIGIHDDDLPRLFRPFCQLDHSSTRPYGGTGLGLAICRDLVKAKNGKIRVTSQPGKGSVFEVLLSYPANLAPLPASGGNAPALNGLHVLLVDDHRTNQLIMTRILENTGVQVTTASDGREALTLCGDHSFDAILMDWHMPVLDGVDATRELRAGSSANKDVPVFALTASALDKDREHCLAAGIDDVLTKPVDTRRLMQLLTQVLKRKNAGD